MVFTCTKPACNHHIPVHRAIGKIAECNRCHNPFVIDKETVQLAKPHCQDCIERKTKPEIDALADLLKDM